MLPVLLEAQAAQKVPYQSGPSWDVIFSVAGEAMDEPNTAQSIA